MRKTRAQELGLTRQHIALGLELLSKPRKVYRRGRERILDPHVVTDENGRIFRQALYKAELDIARHLQRLLAADLPELPVPPGIFGDKQPDQTQREAVDLAASSGVLVLTGGPGTGKTTVCRAITELLESSGQVLCCAPTGKAASRIKKQTGRDAATIHNTIGCQPGKRPRFDSGRPEFGRNGEWIRGGPLSVAALIVDESSMIDTELFAMLLDAIPTGARFLIVGDVDQLPSVGAGRVLFDLIASGIVPVVRLEKIYRQASESRIPYVARDINQGRTPDLNFRGSDFVHVESRGEVVDTGTITPGAQAADRVVGFLTDPTRSIATRKGIALADTQVIAPMYKGECGVEMLNARLQEKINPAPNGDHNGDVFIGRGYSARNADRVIHRKNNYELLVMNGDLGYVVDANPQGLDVNEHFETFWSGKTLEEGPQADLWGDDDAGTDEDDALSLAQRYGGLKVANDDGKQTVAWKEARVLVIDFGGRRVAYTAKQARELELSYALTGHSAQGSEFDAVVIALPCSNMWMLTRSWLYTAVTRASKFCVTVGTSDQFAQAVRNTRGTERRTALKERLAKSTPVKEISSLDSLTLL